MIAVEKKLHLIESLIKENDELVLIKVEEILNKSSDMGKKRFSSLNIGISAEEAAELEQIIEDGCEQINDDDWK